MLNMGQAQTKNLGQIAAIWISFNAPENQRLIWYDTYEQVHKVYDVAIGEWTALNPQIVTNSTISDLRNIAQHSGLSVGKYFFLTDVGTLAVTITTTKIWYVDSFNNYVVNDLAAAITAYINSDNLLIDGSTGVWNNATGKLEFSFNTLSSGENIEENNDYIVIRRNLDGNMSWAKCLISNLVSSLADNSITWVGGFYFNFIESINGIKNRVGGIVGYEKHEDDITTIRREIQSVSQGNQEILSAAESYTDEKTSESALLDKQIVRPRTIYNNPPDVPGIGAKIDDIINIIFSWISVLQNSNKIRVGSEFSANGRSGNVNYSDTVRTAIEKLVYKTDKLKISDNVNLPSNFSKEDYTKSLPVANDPITTAIGRITKYISDLNSGFEAFYRGKFYSYRNGSWEMFEDDTDYAQGISTPAFRIKDGLLTIRIMGMNFSNANLRHGASSRIVPLGFFPSDIASKFINSDYFVVNTFTMYNTEWQDSFGVKYYYSILQVIKTMTIKQSNDNLVNIQIAILFEYAKNAQDVVELTGRVLLGMYASGTNGRITQLTDGDGYNTSFYLQDEVYSLNVNALFA